MQFKTLTTAILLPAMAVVSFVLATPADAARRSATRFDGIRDCERAGYTQFLRHNPTFKRFTIDRAHVDTDKFADRVGPVFVSTIYHGKATYDAAGGTQTVRFICLHGGAGRGAVFVYTLPE